MTDIASRDIFDIIHTTRAMRRLKPDPVPGSDPARFARQAAAVEYFTPHFHEAPVWIVACLEDGPNPTRSAGASIYPAVQNMLLAARALGLGSTLTTRHLLHEKTPKPRSVSPKASIPTRSSPSATRWENSAPSSAPLSPTSSSPNAGAHPIPTDPPFPV